MSISQAKQRDGRRKTDYYPGANAVTVGDGRYRCFTLADDPAGGLTLKAEPILAELPWCLAMVPICGALSQLWR
jgi:hypothetical protein